MKAYQIVLLFLALPLLQYLLGSSLSLKPWILFEPYLIFWLIIPFSWGRELSLLISFAFGFFLDLFFPPYGRHAFSGLWIWALRGMWSRVIRPFHPPDQPLHPETFSLGEWTLYAFPLCTIYLWGYSFLQNLSWKSLLWGTLSASYSFLGILVIFAIFVKQKDAR